MKLDSFKLKIIAMILMVLDHLPKAFNNTPIWFGWLGRLVAPIFFFFVAEGFFHTRSKSKYLIRLFGWGAIMFAGSSILNYALPGKEPLQNNIFLSLGLSVLLMCIIDYTRKSKNYKFGIPLAIIVSIVSLFTEASFDGVLMTLVFYFFREDKIKLSIGYILISLFEFIMVSGEGLTYLNLFVLNYQWLMIFALPLILMYNGERGLNNKFIKYMFYAFYPIHLWIITIISHFLK
ncbi:TraX family protein [Clostridium botulinum]|uniref:Conjugal transfer protein TraX n=2 Tax=Clostridium botulinum TaxID=1491 RepID=A0A6B4I797_CLOBO|nr:TraX family protein [Clostridium botulinum]KRU24451.1 TraX protein [Clostridium sporogenes]ACO85600.1 TraX family protein [Clostridium botulinum A2 str. Kyoto]APC80396.1 traX family protein [Clostridium botulinum]APC85006.1 traX family protein [Clostridium botulinum]APH21621.1 traX family protein [Clostridium botulinum]